MAPSVFAASVVGEILVGSSEVTCNSEDTLRGSRAVWDEKFERANARWDAQRETKREGVKEGAKERDEVEKRVGN